MPTISLCPRPQAPSKSIHDNPLYRFATLLGVKYRRPDRWPEEFLNLTDRICVKYGRRVHLCEASTLRFIAKNTSIPVPKVLSAFTHGRMTYIVMERFEGKPMDLGWNNRSEESRARLFSQLKKMFEELRGLPAPEGMGVASVDGGPLYHHELPGFHIRPGPFKILQDFHRFLRRGPKLDHNPDPDVQRMVKQQSQDWPLVFTHGNLKGDNIRVHGDDVVAIVGWDDGFHPIGSIPRPT